MMKKCLKKRKFELFYYKDGIRIMGENPLMSGNCTGLSGDCTGLYGDLNNCDLSEKDREKGIKITELVGDVE